MHYFNIKEAEFLYNIAININAAPPAEPTICVLQIPRTGGVGLSACSRGLVSRVKSAVQELPAVALSRCVPQLPRGLRATAAIPGGGGTI